MGELILGTAQLGQTYGIANRTGQPDATAAHAIVATAWAQGIRAFDTAPSYGNAEPVLGAALRAIGASDDARVVTKLDAVEIGDTDAAVHVVARSRNTLNVPRLAGLLVRRTLLDTWAGVQPALQRLLVDGVVERVGVSVYTPEEALRALSLDDVSFVQVPTSIIDRRFLTAGVFDHAKTLGKRIAIRSVFLQGLLTMSPEAAPSVPGAREALEGLRRVSEELHMRPVALALAYVRERCPDADVLVGAERPEQVAELAALWGQHAAPCAETIERYVPGSTLDLIDPTRWNAAVR